MASPSLQSDLWNIQNNRKFFEKSRGIAHTYIHGGTFSNLWVLLGRVLRIVRVARLFLQLIDPENDIIFTILPHFYDKTNSYPLSFSQSVIFPH